MLLTRHDTGDGAFWAVDGFFLGASFSISSLLSLSRDAAMGLIEDLRTKKPATGPVLAPIEAAQEVWASGVTYLRSREARKEESDSGDIYQKVYEARRPELFFKSLGWRVMGSGKTVRIRKDSTWNVPEPEMTLVINSTREIIGYCAGNDVSSRSIEGENPLYLPQAKTYDGSCALGPGVVLVGPGRIGEMDIRMEILRAGSPVFEGSTKTSRMNRSPEELVDCLFRETTFPWGVFLMTGTGIVPPESFTLCEGDLVRIAVGGVTLENRVA